MTGHSSHPLSPSSPSMLTVLPTLTPRPPAPLYLLSKRLHRLGCGRRKTPPRGQVQGKEEGTLPPARLAWGWRIWALGRHRRGFCSPPAPAFAVGRTALSRVWKLPEGEGKRTQTQLQNGPLALAGLAHPLPREKASPRQAMASCSFSVEKVHTSAHQHLSPPWVLPVGVRPVRLQR